MMRHRGFGIDRHTRSKLALRDRLSSNARKHGWRDLATPPIVSKFCQFIALLGWWSPFDVFMYLVDLCRVIVAHALLMHNTKLPLFVFLHMAPFAGGWRGKRRGHGAPNALGDVVSRFPAVSQLRRKMLPCH